MWVAAVVVPEVWVAAVAAVVWFISPRVPWWLESPIRSWSEREVRPDRRDRPALRSVPRRMEAGRVALTTRATEPLVVAVEAAVHILRTLLLEEAVTLLLQLQVKETTALLEHILHM